MIKTFFMNAIEKVIGQLVMIPYGIDFNIEEIKDSISGTDEYSVLKININIDDSKIVRTSENYDDDYARTFMEDDIEDKIYSSLRYLSRQDNDVRIIYNHYNKTYMNQLEKEIESVINDYILRASQEDRKKYEFDAFIDASSRTSHLFLTINTNLPDNRQKELWYKLVDEHGYDNLVIEFDEII